MGMNLHSLFASFASKIPASGKYGKAAPAVIDAQDVRITETINPPEPVLVPKPTELEVAREAVSELSNNVYNASSNDEAKVKDTLAQLLKSEGDLKLQTLKLTPDGDIKAAIGTAPLIVPEKELLVQKIKVSAEDAPPAANPGPASPLPVPGDGVKKKSGDMLSSIFSKEEEQHNPLAGLTAAVPDASARDLLDQAKQLLDMLDDWQKSSGGS